MTAAVIDTAPGPPSVWLYRNEAAAHLGVSVKTLSQWAWLKKGPRYARIGSVTRYRLADLEAFMHSQMVETAD